MNHIGEYIGWTVVCAIVFGIWRLKNYAEDEFDHCFFDVDTFVLAMCALFAIGFGLWVRPKFGENGVSFHGVGCVIAAGGAIAYLKIVYCNFRNTNFWVGLAGTASQSVLYGLAVVPCAYLAAVFVPLAMFLYVAIEFGPSPSPQILYRPMPGYY